MALRDRLARVMDSAVPRHGRKAPDNAASRTSNVTYLSAADPAGAKRMRDYSSYLSAITIPNVYKCLSVISSNLCAVPLRILDEDDEQVDTKTKLTEFHDLTTRPNPEMRGLHFRQLLSHHLQLTGNAIVLLDNVDGLGRPRELYVLRPDRCRIIRSDVGALAYGYDVEINRTMKTFWYDGQTEILHVKFAHPSDPLWGFGPIEGGELTFSKDRLVNEFAVNFFSRGAIVDGVLATDREIPEEDRRALVADWRAMREGGGRNKLRTALLWAGATYTPIQEPLGRVPVADLLKASLEDICQLLGVPVQLLGSFEQSNYRNAQEAVQFFYGETLGPILRQLEEDFWNPLLELFEPSLRAEYEQREVVDYQMRADAAAKLAGTGAFAVNDLRVAAGYDPLPEDDELGSLIPLPKGMTLLSPEAAQQLGAQVQEAPEDLPPAPQVTELSGGDGAGQSSAAAPGQEQAGGQQAEQPPSEPRVAQEQPAAKSVVRARRGHKTYPAALLGPQARQEQRRRALAGRAVAATAERAPLLILPGNKAHEEADVPDAGSASPPASPSPSREREVQGTDPVPRPPRGTGRSRRGPAAASTQNSTKDSTKDSTDEAG